MGSIYGVVIGGFMLGFLEATTRFLTTGVWADFMAFVILMAVLIIKPTGMMGQKL